MKTKQLVLNAVIAAMYTAITVMLPSFTPLQLRLSEIFSHLPVFHKKYSLGLILGVAIANFWSPFGIYDVLFGTLHTTVSLLCFFILAQKKDGLVKKMILNTVIFSVNSFIVALMIYILDAEGAIFWGLYASIAASIAVVMAAGIPVMKLLNERIDFYKRMES